MSITRKLARPMMAAMFIEGGLDAFRNPETKKEKAETVAPEVARTVGLVASALTLLVVLVVVAVFDRDDAGRVQLLADVDWAPSLGLSWRIGVDGLSLPFVVLTALLVIYLLIVERGVRAAVLDRVHQVVREQAAVGGGFPGAEADV